MVRRRAACGRPWPPFLPFLPKVLKAAQDLAGVREQKGALGSTFLYGYFRVLRLPGAFSPRLFPGFEAPGSLFSPVIPGF